MQVKFLHNLGRAEAEQCSEETKSKVNWEECKAGETVNLSEAAVEWLNKRHGPEHSLFERVLKGVAKQPEITAPAK